MNLLATICARGGSKGIRNKNLYPLAGEPLIAHTIRQILRWNRASEVVVSTDSEEIAATAKEYGALIPFLRPAELATDESPKLPVLRHTLQECEKIFQKSYECLVDVDVTAPIRKIEDLENSYQIFLEKKPLTLFSVVEARKNPYFNMVEQGAEGYVHLCKTVSSSVHRRQDAPPVYDLNASIYFYQRAYLLDQSNRGPISQRSLAYVMDPLSAFDIDREIDFKFIEFLLHEKRISL